MAGLIDRDVMILQAKWIAPMDRPPIRYAGIAIRSGRIIAVDQAEPLRQLYPNAHVVDFPRHLLLPGLVNAHVHLELSHCHSGPSPGGTFADWILGMRDRMRLDPEKIDATIANAVDNGIAQCLRFGVTCVGDITSFIEVSRRTIRASPLRAVSYGEALGLANLRARFVASLPRAIDCREQSDRLHVGLSPHAPYTVDLPGFVECMTLARQHDRPLATHLAENPDEQAFLTDHAGMFRELWEKLGLWNDQVETYHGSPIAFAKSIGLLDRSALLAHVNYCSDDDLSLLAAGNASVVYCPRTHAYFGHRPHRWRQMLERGINVAVGTDSCASSPDLNLVDDLRSLYKIAPEIAPHAIWEMATIRSARAVTREHEVGSLTPGKAADIVAFEVSSQEPLQELLCESTLPTNVWIDGISLELPCEPESR